LWKEFHRLVTMPSPELSDWLVETREGVEIYAAEPDVDVRELRDGVSPIPAKREEELTPAHQDPFAEVGGTIKPLFGDPPGRGTDSGPWPDTVRTLGRAALRETEELGADFDEEEEYPPDR